jgi:hypothetical protein
MVVVSECAAVCGRDSCLDFRDLPRVERDIAFNRLGSEAAAGAFGLLVESIERSQRRLAPSQGEGGGHKVLFCSIRLV